MWNKILAAIVIVVILIAMTIGGAFGRTFVDAVFRFLSSDGSATSSVPPDQMPIQRVGQLTLKYSFPFVLNEAESIHLMSALPKDVKSQVSSLSVYNSRPTCGLGEVILSVLVYAPEAQVSIDGAAAGIMKQVSTLEGINNPEDSTRSANISGYPARRVSYKANRWGDVLGAEILVVADFQSKTFWQLQFIFATNKTSDDTKLKNIRSCANKIIESASIESAPHHKLQAQLLQTQVNPEPPPYERHARTGISASGREMYFTCSLTGPERVVHQYSFAFDPDKSTLFWVEGTQKLKVIRNTPTQLWASHEMKFQSFPHDVTDFRINRVTGSAEINYLQRPSAREVAKCKKERNWGCEDFLVLTEKSEQGACQIVDRTIR